MLAAFGKRLRRAAACVSVSELMEALNDWFARRESRDIAQLLSKYCAMNWTVRGGRKRSGDEQGGRGGLKDEGGS